MKYMLMAYVQENVRNLTREEGETRMAADVAFTEALTKAGVLVANGRLEQSTAATTVRLDDGKIRVLDGPYLDSKEQLGGYFFVEVADLDAALTWAARCPAIGHGVVEVRPVADGRPVWPSTDE
jgi:hypothetical protein